ncbi:XrtA/PEP-CTERM system histidine kinase PrsK [Arenibaculum pallidiluteum]|uniref:XrtA/PEP-CTERM system histidine kinase PrsK n=1 Tax=Arenibaculum pallidiluteum TaxID=2812559 RepID=UPI001A95F1CD|nr:XrtA/PEP-CTERM system histidine kinase PrsK [Arenibaculum pallidiluteum]
MAHLATEETLYLAGHAIAGVAFAAMALLLAAGWRRGLAGVCFVAAAALASIWSGTELAAMLLPVPAGFAEAAEILRTGGWLVLLVLLMRQVNPDDGRRLLARPELATGVALLAVGLGAAIVPVDPVVALIARLGLAVVGLLLVENLFRWTSASARWSFKHLLLGAGTIFAFDLFHYSEALLFRAVDITTATARPLVNTLVIPLLLVGAARIRSLSLDVSVSREAVFHTTALLGSGIYLVAVAAGGYLMRETGLGIGPLVQILFLVGAAVLLAALLLSGGLRARLRVLISRHFFSFAYDYRREWLRFIATMGPGGADLHERAIAAVAQVLDAGGGALFLRDARERYGLAARWNWPGSAPLAALPSGLAARLDERREVLDLRLGMDLADGAGEEASLAWLRQLDEPWLLVPLSARGVPVGAVLIVQPRAPRALTWEDEDLLGILGVQIGSYIAEEQVARDLALARRFERMSQNFTFMAHDLKNLVSQLSLIVQHAERHGDKPEFRRDAFATIGQSVDKMRAMLVRLKDASATEPRLVPVALDDLLARARHPRLEPGAVMVRALPGDRVRVEPDGFQSVLDNLVHNAAEAGGRVRVAGRTGSGEAVIEVADDGPGMTERFVAEELFRPFSTTKEAGFGLGMFQCRALVEGWGGRLDVESRPGEGTIARITLPLCIGAAAAEQGVETV